MLQNGRSTPVVNGTPLILVTVCRDSRSEYITAAVIDEPEQCDQKELYVARLGAADHFNSSGERLTQAPAIIRQDRANNFVFEKRDLEDQADDFFGLKDNRETLENLLESGRSSPDTLNEIVNGTPLVLVNLCKGNRGDYVNATIIEK